MIKMRWLLAMFCIYCTSCANIQNISGGPEDKTPPKLDSIRSTPNKQIHFNSREIILSFDEWVRLDNPTLNISISPPTEFPPEYRLKGKKLIIRFDQREKLKDDVTYTIQFGESIKDITAGNIQRNLRFVFATGDYLDSLQIEGRVIDAFSRKPKEKILVSLYKLLDDTAFQKIKPYYFSWTDTAGHFLIQNLSAGAYKLYALEDKNQNYFYDQLQEAFAFYPDTIWIRDTSRSKYAMYLSAQFVPLVIKDKKNQPGESRLYFNQKLNAFNLNCDSSSNIKYLNLRDSMLIWNFGKLDDTCIIEYESKKDTLKIPGVSDKFKDSVSSIKLTQPLLKPGEMPSFIMNWPVVGFNKDSIHVLDSFSVISRIQQDTLDPRKFYLNGKYSADKPSKIVFLNSAVIGIHESVNKKDTFTFKYFNKSGLSRLKLSIENLQSGFPYIMQLLSGETVTEEIKFVATENTKKLFYPNVTPGKYRVRLIHDQNANGQWDPGNFKNRQQPEFVWYFDITELRADWDVNVNLKL